jgi:hypothetical protein
MIVRVEDKDGAERWWKSLFCHGQNPALTQVRGDLACSVKTMCYINENIKISKAYQSLPFLRSTLKCS